MPAKRCSTPALTLGIGLVAGLRAMIAPALLSWAISENVVGVGKSFVSPIISQSVSKRTAQLALAELFVDKLPFTPARIKARPLATRILSGSACGAVVSIACRRPGLDGMRYGALGALAGALAGHYARKQLSKTMPTLAVALLEDAVAITAGIAIIWQVARNRA